jgi:hypothetical protein
MKGERFHFPGDDVPALAIFIMPTDEGTHTGILHRDHGNLFILDLLWHRQLRSIKYQKAVPACVIPGLDPDEINDLTAMCRLIHSRHKDRHLGYNIPYAFRHGNNDRFNKGTGELMLLDGLGLTCSTFVLTVFESVYLPLIDFDTWQNREDDNIRHTRLLDMMRNGIPAFKIPPAEPAHVSAVAAELPCVRVRPEEVTAAGMSDSRSVDFWRAERGGRWILEVLTPERAHAVI